MLVSVDDISVVVGFLLTKFAKDDLVAEIGLFVCGFLKLHETEFPLGIEVLALSLLSLGLYCFLAKSSTSMISSSATRLMPLDVPLEF